MSLAPLNRGVAGNGRLTLEPGWKLQQNEFGVDVLTCRLFGTRADVLQYCPAKYSVANLPGLSLPGFICSRRGVSVGDGNSGVAELEYKGFLNLNPPDPQSELVWQEAQQTIAFGLSSISFPCPSIAQYTVKKAVSGNIGAGSIGQYGVPYGAENIPGSFTTQISIGKQLYSVTMKSIVAFQCTKDDWNKTGSINEETQLWEKNFYADSIRQS